MAYIRVTAKFSTIISSQDISDVSRVKAQPAQEHMASKAEVITTPHAARESYDLSGLTETWGDSVHDWNTAMKGHMHQEGQKGRNHALCEEVA